MKGSFSRKFPSYVRWLEKRGEKKKKTQERKRKRFRDSWLNQVPPSSHAYDMDWEIFRRAPTMCPSQQDNPKWTVSGRSVVKISPPHFRPISLFYSHSLPLNQTVADKTKDARIPAEHHRPLYIGIVSLHILPAPPTPFGHANSFFSLVSLLL